MVEVLVLLSFLTGVASGVAVMFHVERRRESTATSLLFAREDQWQIERTQLVNRLLDRPINEGLPSREPAIIPDGMVNISDLPEALRLECEHFGLIRNAQKTLEGPAGDGEF